jgi:hypothetical protein
MTSDSTNAYADRVTITFRQVQGRTGTRVLDAYELQIHPQGTIDLDWLDAEIRTLFLGEPDSETGIRYLRDSFVLTQTRTDMNWGASASAVHFLVETGAFIGKEGAAALIGAGILKLVQTLKDGGCSVVAGRPEALSDDEAARFGLRLIEREYDADLPALTLTAIGVNELKQHVCTASARDGSTYTVTFDVRRGEPVLISRNRTIR